jgi:hypothetical protein
MCVPQDEWAPREHIINITIAVGIVKKGSGPFFNEEGLTPNSTKGSHRGIYTTWDQGLSIAEKFNRAINIRWHLSSPLFS